jgi:hypothetical protein
MVGRREAVAAPALSQLFAQERSATKLDFLL